MKEIHDACQSDHVTKGDEDDLKLLRENKDDKQVGVHMLCMATKAGLMDSHNHLHKDTIRKKMTLGAAHDADIDELVKKCAVTKDTAEETAVHLFICNYENDVHYYHRL